MATGRIMKTKREDKVGGAGWVLRDTKFKGARKANIFSALKF
jgi:hypothetical protein